MIRSIELGKKCWICNGYLSYSKTTSEVLDDEFYDCLSYRDRNEHNFTYMTYTYGGEHQQKILCNKEINDIDIEIDYHYNERKKGDLIIYTNKLDSGEIIKSKRLYMQLDKQTLLKIFNDVDYLNFLETYS